MGEAFITRRGGKSPVTDFVTFVADTQRFSVYGVRQKSNFHYFVDSDEVVATGSKDYVLSVIVLNGKLESIWYISASKGVQKAVGESAGTYDKENSRVTLNDNYYIGSKTNGYAYRYVAW